MVSITLSIPSEVKKRMETFPEMNWSGFVRKCIEEKARQLAWQQEMLSKYEREKELTGWAVALGRKAREGRGKHVVRKGR